MVSIPKKTLEEILEAGWRFAAAEETLEDVLLAADPAFLKKMRRLRGEHRRGRIGNWNALKIKHGL